MVSVAKDQAAKLAQVARARSRWTLRTFCITEVTGLIHHHHAQPIAGVEKLGGRRIVAATVSVGAHLLQPLDAPLEEPVRNRDADAGVVLVIARPLDLDAFTVENKSAIRVEVAGSDAEGRSYVVDSFAA